MILSRLEAAKRVLGLFSNAAPPLLAALWPDFAQGDVRSLAWQLRDATERLHEWRRSSARVGAELALTTALSWYPEISLEQLATLRDAFSPSQEQSAAIRQCAQEMALYAHVCSFIAPLPEPEDEELVSEEEEGSPTADDPMDSEPSNRSPEA